MTNMNELVNTSTELASKSPWAWLIIMFLGWLLVSAYGIRYTTRRLEESSARLLSEYETRMRLVQELMQKKEELHVAHASRLENIIRDQLQGQHELSRALIEIRDILKARTLA